MSERREGGDPPPPSLLRFDPGSRKQGGIRSSPSPETHSSVGTDPTPPPGLWAQGVPSGGQGAACRGWKGLRHHAQDPH